MSRAARSLSPKSRLVALLLCWLLGGFGAHRFYVGKWKTGLALPLLSISGVGLLTAQVLALGTQSVRLPEVVGPLIVPSVLAALWILVDLIRILLGQFSDAEGRPVFKWTEAGSI